MQKCLTFCEREEGSVAELERDLQLPTKDHKSTP